VRRPAAQTNRRPRIAKSTIFPAPVGGWIKNTNLATPGARLPDGSAVNGAYLLDNWWPTATAVRMRGGTELFATVGDGTEVVVQMFIYLNGNERFLFAATQDAIYDVTNGDAVETGAVEDLTSGEWTAVQFATPGGVFLSCVNGYDLPQVFDGTSWSTTPAITGDGLDPSLLSHVWSYSQRLFFIEKDTFNAWYLTADSIGGEATKLPLGGVFRLGGSLLFGATWSIETGNGLNQQCIFVTTEGECAVYQGSDPSTTSTWSKVGLYRIGKPLGSRAVLSAGGDLAIATNIGFIPLSQAVMRDFAALSPVAISYKIETAWNDAVASRGVGWCCAIWPTKQLVLVSPPPSLDSDQPFVLGTNARTGSWGRALGWDARCLALFDDRMFYGTENGAIVECEVTGSDMGSPYTATCVSLFDPMKSPACLKISLEMRAVIRAPYEAVPQLSLQTDYALNLPAAPADSGSTSGSVWGVGIWGKDVWDSPHELLVFERWQSVGGAGYSLAPGVQITSGRIEAPNIELVQVDVTYDQADIVS